MTHAGHGSVSAREGPAGARSLSAADLQFPDHHGDAHEMDSHEDSDADTDAATGDVENVQLRTVGIDIGSSTTHLMFAMVHMQRLSQALSSRYVIVDRRVVWQSPVLLTPYLPDNSIDATVLGAFVDQCYQDAGVAPSAVDSGAVVLTGEALKRRNARAIADLFATEAGTFVCASAGHQLEAVMAAHGSGAVADSRQDGDVHLHVDIGGGTAKLAVVVDGVILGTAAVAVGGRLVALEGRTVVRVEGPALQVAQAAGIPLTLGGQLSEEDEQRLTRAFVDVLLGCIETGRVPEPYPADLLLVDDRPAGVQPGVVSFSGGVGEYIYGRETRSFGDVAPSLAEELRRAMSAGRLPMRVVGSRNHIRATVIGASQFSVQISGNTVGLSGASVLPLRNVPVLSPKITLGADMDADAVGAAVEAAARKFDVFPDGHAVAVALRWEGAPEYSRLRALAEGLAKGVASQLEARQPLVVLLDGDVARSLGLLLADELQVLQPVICLDGVKLEEFDYVDIGEIVQPAGAVPLVIKSLLFAHNEPVVPGIGVLAR